MAQYSADNPPQYGRTEVRGDGTVWVIPQQLVPDPSQLTAGKLVDDPSSPPYQQATGTKASPSTYKLTPGQVVIDAGTGNVVASAPGKAAAPQKPITVAPGDTVVGQDGTILYTAPAKPAANAATAASTNAKNTATAALDQARVDAMKKASWASVQGELDAIDQQFQAGSLTADQRDQAKKGVVDNAIQSTVTGLSAAQRAAVTQKKYETDQTAATSDQTAADTLIDKLGLVPAGALTTGPDGRFQANAVPASQYSDVATYIAHQIANQRTAQVGAAPTSPAPYTPPTAPQFTAPAATAPAPAAPAPAPNYSGPSYGGPPPSYGTNNSPTPAGAAGGT